MSEARELSKMAERKASLPRKALKARKRAKKKKPAFVRSESWRYSKLSESWRRPRGLDHKMRRKIKGWPPTVSVGYKGPKIARGLHPSGYKEVLVHNADEVSGIDPKVQAARIAHTVGKKKRALIIAAARKRKVVILNVKEIKAPAEEKKEEKPEEKPTEEQKKTVEKAEKTKRRVIGRKKAEQEAKELPEKKAAKPKKSKKAAKTEEGVEKQ
jgi:large subunit ribosomal protein L32e